MNTCDFSAQLLYFVALLEYWQVGNFHDKPYRHEYHTSDFLSKIYRGVILGTHFKLLFIFSLDQRLTRCEAA